MSTAKEQIVQFIDGRRNEMVELWRDLVNQDTYSDYKEGVKALLELVKTVSSENGFGILYGKFSGGGADSAYTVMAGVPTVCAMGVKGGRNHSTEEFAVVETLFERAKLLALCVLNLDRLNK